MIVGDDVVASDFDDEARDPESVLLFVIVVRGEWVFNGFVAGHSLAGNLRCMNKITLEVEDAEEVLAMFEGGKSDAVVRERDYDSGMLPDGGLEHGISFKVELAAEMSKLGCIIGRDEKVVSATEEARVVATVRDLACAWLGTEASPAEADDSTVSVLFPSNEASGATFRWGISGRGTWVK